MKESLKNLLRNSYAPYSKFHVAAIVKMKDGNTKDVSQLSKADLDELMPVDHNERMEDYMKEVVTALKKLTGEEIREKTNLANATFDDYYKNYQSEINALHTRARVSRYASKKA